MPACPRCNATTENTDIQCPQCGLTLKAHGHPGIPLHRAESGVALCETCLYHLDDTCNFPQRPEATSCTLYRSIHAKEEPLPPPAKPSLTMWLRRNQVVVVLLVLIGVSVLLAVMS